MKLFMKLFMKGKHNNQSKLILGKASSIIELSLPTEMPEDIAGIPFYGEQNQRDPEVLDILNNIFNEGSII